MSLAEQEAFYTKLLNKLPPDNENREEISLHLWYIQCLREKEESGVRPYAHYPEDPNSIISMGDI